MDILQGFLFFYIIMSFLMFMEGVKQEALGRHTVSDIYQKIFPFFHLGKLLMRLIVFVFYK